MGMDVDKEACTLGTWAAGADDWTDTADALIEVTDVDKESGEIELRLQEMPIRVRKGEDLFIRMRLVDFQRMVKNAK